MGLLVGLAGCQSGEADSYPVDAPREADMVMAYHLYNPNEDEVTAISAKPAISQEIPQMVSAAAAARAEMIRFEMAFTDSGEPFVNTGSDDLADKFAISELIALCRNRIALNLVVRSGTVPAQIADKALFNLKKAIRDSGMEAHLLISSDDTYWLDAFSGLNSDVTLAQIFESTCEIEDLHPAARVYEKPWFLLSDACADSLKAQGRWIHASAADTDSAMVRAFLDGAEGIITQNPDLLLTAMRQLNVAE